MSNEIENEGKKTEFLVLRMRLVSVTGGVSAEKMEKKNTLPGAEISECKLAFRGASSSSIR